MKKILLFKKKNKTFHLVTLNSSCVHHSTLWKSWNMQSGLNKSERQNCMYWHKYLHLCLYKSKKSWPPCPNQHSVFSCSPTRTFLYDCQQTTWRWELGTKSVVPKSSKLLCQSLNRGLRSISQRCQAAQQARSCEVTAAVLCMLLLAASPVKANTGLNEDGSIQQTTWHV